MDDSLCENRLIPRPHQLRSCGGGTCRPAVWQVDTVGVSDIATVLSQVGRIVWRGQTLAGRERVWSHAYTRTLDSGM